MDIASKLERDGEIMDNVAAIIRKGIKEAERQLKVEADLGVSSIMRFFFNYSVLLKAILQFHLFIIATWID